MDSENNSSQSSLTGIHLAAAILSKMAIDNSEGIIRPVQIFKLRKNRHLEFTGEHWLQQFLNAPENKRKLFFPWIVSGKLRSGKSTLVNLLLEALELESVSTLVDGGFDWGFGDEPITNGILCWPKPIKVRMPISEDSGSFLDVFVLLFDSQGLFDAETEFIDCVRLFGISMKIAQIFICNINSICSNLLNNLGEMLTLVKELEKMSIYEEIGRNEISNLEENNSKTDFWFLLRNSAGKCLGIEGGERVKKQWFGETNCIELKQSIELLNANFRSIHSFLLPPAGELICNGELEEKLLNSNLDYLPINEDIGVKFTKFIREFVRHILDKEQPIFVEKDQCQQFYTGEELFERIKNCYQKFAIPPMDQKFTVAERIKKSKNDRNEMAAILFAKNKFNELMEERFSPGKSYANPIKFGKIAQNALRLSLMALRSKIDPNSIHFVQFKLLCKEIVSNFIHLYDIYAEKNDGNKTKLRSCLDKPYVFLGAAFFAGGVAGMAGGAFLGALAPTLLPLSTGMPVGFTTMGSASMVLAQKKQMEIKDRIGIGRASEFANDDQMGQSMTIAEQLGHAMIEEDILWNLYRYGIIQDALVEG